MEKNKIKVMKTKNHYKNRNTPIEIVVKNQQ